VSVLRSGEGSGHSFVTPVCFVPCYVGPCHHGMALPVVADGGDGLCIWRVAANIVNKQSRTADKGWSSGLGGCERS
jgi:thiamine biosynthesis protein ThiC